MNTNQWKLADHIIGRNLFLTKDHLKAVKGIIRTLRSTDPRCLVRCDNQALLNYYTRIIAKLLKTTQDGGGNEGIDVEVVAASSGDGFLDAINRQIEDIGLEQAVSLTDSSVARRCLIVTNAENLGRENEEALRYLLKDFPAINLACLFSTSLSPEMSDGLLSLFQPAPAEYRIDIPSAELLAEIRHAASSTRNEQAVVKLLDRLFG